MNIRLLSLLFSLFFTTTSYAQCWNLVWSDEFSGTALNTADWSYNTGAGGWGNNELQYYTARTENVSVDNGSLKIKALAENYMGSNYTSARIVTKDKVAFAYGKFVARLKLPTGQGIWPAFWMLADNSPYGGWPYGGEIDIMELIGNQPARSYGTIHGANGNVHVSYGNYYDLPSGIFADAFHEFSVEWEPGTIRYYIDNILYQTITNTQLGANPWPFDQPFSLLLNIAVGGNWPGSPNINTVFPQTMEADWIRIYQKLEDVAVSGPTLVEPGATSTTYTAGDIPGTTYTWSVPTDATIASGQGTHSIQVNWGSTGGEVAVQLNNGCGTITPSLTVDVSTNIWANPAFEQDLANWNFRTGNTATGNIAITTTNVQQGTKAASIQVITAGVNPWDVQLSRLATGIIPGQQYTLSFWVRADATRLASFAFIHPTNYTWYAGGNFTATTAWQKITLNFTAPAGQTALLFNIDLGRFSAATYVVDNFELGQTLLLPIELYAFTGQRSQAQTVSLQWSAFEREVDHYELERADGNDLYFKTIGRMPATGDNTRETYQFEDNNVPEATLYYRIASFDNDGTQQKSAIVTVESLKIPITIAPNPTQNTFRIVAALLPYAVEITDVSGRIIERRTETNSDDSYSLADYPTGTYYIKVWISEKSLPVSSIIQKQ